MRPLVHNEVMVIDHATVITGSFNFTKAAEERNAENLLVITEAPELVQAYEVDLRAHAAHSPSLHAARHTAPAATAPAGAVRGNQRSTVYRVPRCKRYAAMTSADARRLIGRL